MPPLPAELVDAIIDIVAEFSPQWLPSCAFVSREWSPRSIHHLNRIFRAPTITSFDALLDFTDVVKRHPRLAALATSLAVTPDLTSNSAWASYVPFHHLSSRLLPNVRHLLLGRTLRWADYPPLYRSTGTVASLFSEVTVIELSCCFDSISDLFRTIRSFKNVKDVRLTYPHHSPPQWIFSDQVHPAPGRSALPRRSLKIQNLEMSASSQP